MLSFAISNFDIALLIGGGFGAVCVIMGVIAYASMQTMKSVKADNKWKELAFWAGKRDITPVDQAPASLQSMMNKLSLSAPTYAQFQLTGSRASTFPSTASGTPEPSAAQLGPKQELIPWWDASTPVADTLLNDSADTLPDVPLESSPITSVAPPPFGDEVRTTERKMQKIPQQEYRIVIGDRLKSTARAKRARQRRKSAPLIGQRVDERNEHLTQIKEAKQEANEQLEGRTISLPSPLAQIEETITPPLAMPGTMEEMETPLISKRNVKSLIKKSRSGFNP